MQSCAHVDFLIGCRAQAWGGDEGYLEQVMTRYRLDRGPRTYLRFSNEYLVQGMAMARGCG